MNVDLSHINGLAGRGGESPERNHEYVCPDCLNEEYFIGISDYGQPGMEYECPRCGGKPAGDPKEPCWCPAYSTFLQPFYLNAPL